ncbi:division/cell wall cluster transcriptional repressor MraZ [Maribellus mangrovi]|uniref:division/cell wall cluster transcriptional repressor MraZ n=1 Tax=Maribellus mangrovi TaxID=3133146 RepID=UPI0030EC6C07
MATFAGQYNATIDDKGRVVLPSAFKKAVGEMQLDFVVVERNRRSKCLDLHTVDTWKKEVERFREKLNPETNPMHDKLLQLYFQNFVQVGVAANGRINIPNEFLEYANLKDKVTFIGMQTSIRLSAAVTASDMEVSDADYLELLKLIDKKEE